MRRVLIAGFVLLVIAFLLAAIPPPPAPSNPAPAIESRVADFGRETPSADARQVADWVADSGDAAGIGFLIVDKKNARLYVFDGEARLRGASAVLLGAARGDDSTPGIGSRPLEQVLLQERTTPAGRFVSERGRNLRGQPVVWLDYDGALSMHPVVTANQAERRLERLATPAVDDNRISYGCINVPEDFFEARVRPVFAAVRAMIYVLPEHKSLQQVFRPSEAG